MTRTILLVRLDSIQSIHVEILLVGPGSKELIYLCMVMFRGEVLLPAPAWTTYSPQVSSHS